MPNWLNYIPIVGLVGRIIDKSVNDEWDMSKARTGTEIGLDTLVNIVSTLV